MSVRLGSQLDSNDIREGMDVFFECEVDANPKIKNVLWKRNVSISKGYLVLFFGTKVW